MTPNEKMVDRNTNIALELGKETLVFHTKDESLITFEFQEKMLILLSDKTNTTEITLDKNSIQILKNFINRLEL